ncbi:hypothetical protein SAMN05444162_2162 [Paenibacillaceae bacterium GAS479]|nr:hypothetical protein SAMN05444162_2162 [Paenibacillaceae bacterium GAS479]
MLQRFSRILGTRGKFKGLGITFLFLLFIVTFGILSACGNDASTAGTSPNPETAAPSSNNNNSLSTETPKNTPIPSTGSGKQDVAPGNDAAREFLNSKDGQSLQTTARSFVEAYLNGNHEEMRKLLIDPKNKSNKYPTENLMDNVESMTLKLTADNIKNDMIKPSFEIVYKNKDTFDYLGFEMRKIEDEWMIGDYYLEQ